MHQQSVQSPHPQQGREMAMTGLLTTHQVQDLLKVDRTTIYRMVEAGRLPAIRVGKQWRFEADEVERWLHERATLAPLERRLRAPDEPAPDGLRALLPLECAQMIQDAFAEALDVMMVTTDMDGQPITQVSHPCGFFIALMQDANAVEHCVGTWKQLAAAPAIEPRPSPSEIGLLCARGLIRVGNALKGMVLVGGIAPERWPPSDDRLSELARTFGADEARVKASTKGVYRLDHERLARVLRGVQRVADIFSHIAMIRQGSDGTPLPKE
ncbi:PocR ligand-binding domain-containing protein [Candidatus Roseilinea sp. NK_OTU-006]|jgi:excisionase family DNA binding protein|uniref:PocR ligand-binding domain-containing protein n=1 Tax=Candidatus Roseilinea sp. NK_OTU-006 TaxID=2704250 RepID=UPI001F0A0DFB|nr:PocR ligand-binding domain-containing protein [Candidatus Roseilinea sp. NK_OTU-006]